MSDNSQTVTTPPAVPEKPSNTETFSRMRALYDAPASKETQPPTLVAESEPLADALEPETPQEPPADAAPAEAPAAEAPAFADPLADAELGAAPEAGMTAEQQSATQQALASVTDPYDRAVLDHALRTGNFGIVEEHYKRKTLSSLPKPEPVQQEQAPEQPAGRYNEEQDALWGELVRGAVHGQYDIGQSILNVPTSKIVDHIVQTGRPLLAAVPPNATPEQKAQIEKFNEKLETRVMWAMTQAQRAADRELAARYAEWQERQQRQPAAEPQAPSNPLAPFGLPRDGASAALDAIKQAQDAFDFGEGRAMQNKMQILFRNYVAPASQKFLGAVNRKTGHPVGVREVVAHAIHNFVKENPEMVRPRIKKGVDAGADATKVSGVQGAKAPTTMGPPSGGAQVSRVTGDTRPRQTASIFNEMRERFRQRSQ